MTAIRWTLLLAMIVFRGPVPSGSYFATGSVQRLICPAVNATRSGQQQKAHRRLGFQSSGGEGVGVSTRKGPGARPRLARALASGHRRRPVPGRGRADSRSGSKLELPLGTHASHGRGHAAAVPGGAGRRAPASARRHGLFHRWRGAGADGPCAGRFSSSAPSSDLRSHHPDARPRLRRPARDDLRLVRQPTRCAGRRRSSSPSCLTAVLHRPVQGAARTSDSRRRVHLRGIR